MIGGHRGASARLPENTLAAFRAAIEDGAEMIELDVRLTRDGRLAVVHDEDTRRVTGRDGLVARLTMDELRARDAGHTDGARGAGTRIPELGEVFALARGRVIVNVEIKAGTAALPALTRSLAAHDMAASVILSAFEPEVVRAAARLPVRPLTGILVDRLAPDPMAAVREANADLLHVRHDLLASPAPVEALHDAGIGVLAWTVNSADEAHRLAALGVDAVLGDDPRLLREALARP